MMENTLSQFDEIEMFQTRIYGYNSGHIEVTFKKEFEHGGFPSHLKQIVIGKAANYGGATWNVYGINDANFNNATSSEYKAQRILLNGYNYDQLYRYAQEVVKNLEKTNASRNRQSMGGLSGTMNSRATSFMWICTRMKWRCNRSIFTGSTISSSSNSTNSRSRPISMEKRWYPCRWFRPSATGSTYGT